MQYKNDGPMAVGPPTEFYEKEGVKGIIEKENSITETV